MKKIIIITILATAVLASCKKELDVKNPNNPTPQSASTESGIISLAEGSIYTDGFTSNGIKYYDGVMGAFYAGVYGIHSIMGDELDDEAANEYLNQIGCPYSVTLEDGTVILNNQSPQKQPDLIRQINQNSYSGNNPLYYEWAYMYNLNNAANNILALVDNITFSGDADTKKNTLKAWSFWWKGFAYSRLGSIYYAGIIDSVPGATNGDYVTKEAIIAEANANFDKAATLLGSITNTGDYTALMTQLIPDIFQVDKGVPPSTAEWIRNINTYKARNILVNNTVASMTVSQWDSVLNYTNNGIGEGDAAFTARANQNGDFVSYTSGTVAAKSVGDPNSEASYIIQERLIEDFKPGDLRFLNNFDTLPSPFTYPDRGIALGTRWELADGGKGISGVAVLGSKTPDEYELYMACSYEENELMKAEALIHTGDITGGLALVDEVRAYQGAGLAAVSGVVTDMAAALEEVRKERRIGLMFRGLAFYDARRLGIINDVSNGGGRTHAWFIDDSGGFHPDVTIDYDYLDYWDVPDNELAYNPAASGSAPTKNPK